MEKSQVDHVVLTGGTVTLAPARGKKTEEASGRSPFMGKVYEIRDAENLTLAEAVKQARKRFPELHRQMLEQG